MQTQQYFHQIHHLVLFFFLCWDISRRAVYSLFFSKRSLFFSVILLLLRTNQPIQAPFFLYTQHLFQVCLLRSLVREREQLWFHAADSSVCFPKSPKGPESYVAGSFPWNELQELTVQHGELQMTLPVINLLCAKNMPVQKRWIFFFYRILNK